MRPIIVLLLTIGFACLIFADDGQDATKGDFVGRLLPSRKQHLPKIFDFANYKSLFKKVYSSWREDLVRAKLFMARAFRVFISGIAFKHRTSSFYLAINEKSDWTPAEIIKSIPKIKPLPPLDEHNQDCRVGVSEGTFKPVLLNEIDVKKELDAIDKEASLANNEVYATISSEVHKLESQESAKERRKRASGNLNDNLRDFSLDNLIKKPEVSKNKEDVIPSNNPLYEPPELVSMGSDKKRQEISDEELDGLLEMTSDNDDEEDEFVDAYDTPLSSEESWQDLDDDDDEDEVYGDARDIPFAPFDESKSPSRSYLGTLIGWFKSSVLRREAEKEQEERKEKLPDEVFVDHSKRCMTEVKSQGQCGSCYAFSFIAFYEWLICKQTGKLVRLSEQYVVDCGKESEFKSQLLGCEGGFVEKAAGFFEQFGLELSRNYPYVGQEGTCPYDDHMKANNMTGYFRLQGTAGLNTIIPYEEFAQQLAISPIIIQIGTMGSFNEYGGGIHQDSRCCEKFTLIQCGDHAVVLVGHGREDGEEYWIIRNSHSIEFGEKGYYRLSKESDCIWPKYGVVYAFEKYDKDDKINIEVQSNKYRTKEIQAKIDDLSRYEPAEHRGVFQKIIEYASDLMRP